MASSVVPQEIFDLVPDDLRQSKFGIFYKASTKTYFVYRDKYHYSPEKKRSVAERLYLGLIRDGSFEYSPAYLQMKKIEQLQASNQALKKKAKERAAEALSTNLPKGMHTLENIKNLAAQIEDPRQESKVQFPLKHVLVVSLLSALSSFGSSAVSISIYWKQFHKELRTLFDDFPEANITHDTVNRIFRVLPTETLKTLLVELAEPLITEASERLFHIDGQSVRASKGESGNNGVYFFNAFDSSNGIVVACNRIEDKKNEVSSSVELLKSFDIGSGDIITADAMNTQTTTVRYIMEKGAGYCLAVKANHEKLYDEILTIFAKSDASRFREYTDMDSGHGRVEQRTTTVLPASLLPKSLLSKWVGLKDGCLVRVYAKSEAKSKRARASEEYRYYISTVAFTDGAAERCGEIVRRHWSIENSVHWVLDSTFGQDRIHCQNMTYLSNRVLLNKIAFNTLKACQKKLREQNIKYSMPTLQQLCSTPAGCFELILPLLGTETFLKKFED